MHSFLNQSHLLQVLPAIKHIYLLSQGSFTSGLSKAMCLCSVKSSAWLFKKILFCKHLQVLSIPLKLVLLYEGIVLIAALVPHQE